MFSKGIHHITAIAGNPQTNIDFYSGLLELKLVKKTINFDDPGTYHFYYGNEKGDPGTILTFFPWGRNALRGRGGRGQVIAIAFSIPVNSLPYWEKRLNQYKVVYTGPYDRFGEKVITFEDPDGLEIELIESAQTNGNNLNSIQGFHSATMSIESLVNAEFILRDIFAFKPILNENIRYRFKGSSEGPGNIIDVLVVPDSVPGIMGVGAVHHIAFRAADDTTQAEMKKAVEGKLISITPVIDRKYFRSVYFREPNGVLFEIATDPPGFGVDESTDSLGKKLQLPEWLEDKRDLIEKSLQNIAAPSPERIFLSE
jgi:glyoxalase family protein